jgi:DNA-binding LytR/AlgR family response regulator
MDIFIKPINDIAIVILEDDPIDQIKIKIMLSEPISSQYNFRIEGVFTQLGDLLLYLTNHQVDLILSDIFIQNETVGIELLRKLRDTTTPIVLMTGSQENGLFLEAQKYRSVHYLIKPFHAISLQSAIEKALDEYNKSKQYDFLDKKYLYLSSKTGQRDQVWFTEIVYIEAEDNYCYIHTPTKKYVLKKSLSKLLSDDLDARFIRIQHKYAVNKLHIKKAETDIVQLTGELVLPVGRSFRKELNDAVKRHTKF